MNSSDQNPKLPTWLFVLTDVALIGVAALIAYTQNGRPSTPWTIAIVVCVAAGAVLGLLPLVARYERQKNEMLDERQRALEALSRTVAASAEQISIAANGLHEIADLAQKNLKHAEQLPHKLQDKIAEFQAQLAQATDADREELERELLALRTTESERLESVSQRIAKSSAEWSKLEAATQQHLTAATEALAKLPIGTANAIGKAQAAAEQALAQARVEGARHVGEAAGQATRMIEAAKLAAVSEFQSQLTQAARAAVDSITTALRTVPASAVSARVPEPAVTSAETHAAAAPERVDHAIPELDAPTPPAPAGTTPSAIDAGSAPPAPKRVRKPRREETAPAASPMDTAAVVTSPDEPSVAASADVDHSSSANEESPPVPISQFEEITPVAPLTAPPFPPKAGFTTTAVDDPAAPTPVPTAADELLKPGVRKRAPRKEAEPDDQPGLGLDLDDPSSRAAAAGILDRVLSSDGATRLLVTAYIGIGNRLFIRGEGPGLSWERGIPLQFVSIGKWRWETNDANGPVAFRLYKNDDVECSALGQQTLEPGHQQEVTAAF